MTSEFEQALASYMRERGIKTKSEALRIAVREGLERALESGTCIDHREWIGLGRAVSENPRPRFSSDDDLWG